MRIDCGHDVVIGWIGSNIRCGRCSALLIASSRLTRARRGGDVITSVGSGCFAAPGAHSLRVDRSATLRVGEGPPLLGGLVVLGAPMGEGA